ncbi:hypothetical protein MNBD_GAMMA19-760, partial [hydrothermal vent metagenome]
QGSAVPMTQDALPPAVDNNTDAPVIPAAPESVKSGETSDVPESP